MSIFDEKKEKGTNDNRLGLLAAADEFEGSRNVGSRYYNSNRILLIAVRTYDKYETVEYSHSFNFMPWHILSGIYSSFQFPLYSRLDDL